MIPLTRLSVRPSSKKKKSRKKVHLSPNHVADENKTQQFKALEAFVMKYHHSMDDVDLSGGEDPIILHYMIASYPSITAHKEVMKFKRRPHYLEMLVHLVNTTLAKGHHDRVMEWLGEGFLWLSKRNEVLLNPRKDQSGTGKGRLAKPSNLFSAGPSKIDLKKSSQKLNTAGGSSGSMKAISSGSAVGGKHTKDQKPGVSEHAKGKDRRMTCNDLDPTRGKKTSNTASFCSTRVAATAIVRREPVLSGGREFYIRNSLRQSVAAELSSQIRITKEDLEAKSVFILITKLPEIWRTHRSRY
jgi:hypothetical protein